MALIQTRPRPVLCSLQAPVSSPPPHAGQEEEEEEEDFNPVARLQKLKHSDVKAALLGSGRRCSFKAGFHDAECTNHVTLGGNEAFRAQWETHSCPTFLLWSGMMIPVFRVRILCLTEGNQQEALQNLFSCSKPPCRKMQLSIFVSGLYETQNREMSSF